MSKKNENRPPMIQAAVTTMFHHVLSIYDPFGRCGPCGFAPAAVMHAQHCRWGG